MGRALWTVTIIDGHASAAPAAPGASPRFQPTEGIITLWALSGPEALERAVIQYANAIG